MIPSVSVVMPSYNHAAYVAEAIRSVLDQSHGDLEIVITDDGSRDGTPDVIRRIDDSRISLEVFDRNQGAACAMNASIRRSRGEFICMLASDDCFLPGKLETQVKFLRANPEVAAVFAMPRFIDQRGAPLDSSIGDVFQVPFAKNLRTRPDWLRHFFYEGNCLCHPASMVRRGVYDRIGLFDRRLANLLDFDMWVRMCMEHEIRVIPDELTAMRILDGSRNMSAPRRDSKLRSQIEYFHVLKHYRRLPRAVIAQVFAREIASAKLDAERSVDVVLAEMALLGVNPLHKLFALDSMFEAMREAGDPSRLIELTGAIDVFALQVREEAVQVQADAARTIELNQRLADRLHTALQATYAGAARLDDQLGVERVDAARTIELNQRLADRLHTALRATYAEAARLDDQLGTERADAARTIELNQRLADRLHTALRATYAEAARLDDQLGTEQAEAARTIELKQRLADRLHAALRATYAEATRLDDQLGTERADAARTIELNQRLADRLHAALRATYAEAARLDDQLGEEQVDRARLTSALQAIEDHASSITTRSRAYRLLRLLKGLRRRIEMIAGEASRALHPNGG